MPLPVSEYVPQFMSPDEEARARGRALRVWGAILAVAAAWVAAIASAPLLRAGGYGVASAFVYKVFSATCHQMPGRSFHFAGEPLAVCARCAGLYAGALGGLLFYPAVRGLAGTGVPRRGWLFLAVAPTGLDFALGFFGVWENTHWSRFLTALPAGAACAFYIVPGFVGMCAEGFRRRGAPRAPARAQG
ncbi:MAG TPA: DUF2085 domain-containing protein [Pyrinomonadaceae bacterium]|jgi:uncharacterized membrane protein|nr:DUF2085 domain-containing protein [Pyrinomonadaceae bacterium]